MTPVGRFLSDRGRTVVPMELLRAGCVVCRGVGAALCAGCLARTEPPPSTTIREVGRVSAALAYAGHGASIVQAFKYRDGRRLAAPLADLVVAAAGDHDAAVVTWVPTTRRRRRERGFDQAEVLARAVGRRAGLPVRRLLRRRPGPSLTPLDRAHRATAVEFRAGAGCGGTVWIVDDVCTTGATLRAARRALVGAGHGDVVASVVARTP